MTRQTQWFYVENAIHLKEASNKAFSIPHRPPTRSSPVRVFFTHELARIHPASRDAYIPAKFTIGVWGKCPNWTCLIFCASCTSPTLNGRRINSADSTALRSRLSCTLNSNAGDPITTHFSLRKINLIISSLVQRNFSFLLAT